MIGVLTTKLALLALFAVLAVVFFQVILFPVPAANPIARPQKSVTQVGDGRTPILYGIILTRRKAASFSSKVLQSLATPPIATAFIKTYRCCFSDFGLSAGATLAIAYPIQVVCGLNLARAEFLQTVILAALISRSGVEIYQNCSKCALN